MAETTYHSPLGLLRLREAHGHLTHLDWGPALETELLNEPGPQDDDSPLLNRAVHQLNAYFFCGLRHFDLPLAPQGTAFQRAVWQQMQAIPYGDTRTQPQKTRDTNTTRVDRPRRRPSSVGSITLPKATFTTR